MSSDKIKNKVNKLLTATTLADVVQINKWWEKPIEDENNQQDEDEEEDIKWKHLEHNGVLFPEEYNPHKVKIKYKGEDLELTPEQEEVATFWAQVLDNDLSKKQITIKNFTNEFKKVLPDKYKNASLSDFDFSSIKKYLEDKKLKDKEKTAEQKKTEKEKKQKFMDIYGWALIDANCEKMSNILVEPPGIFRGRGEQPLTGTIKKRIYSEDVTVNVGKDEPVPICTQKGHAWGEVVNNPSGTWLAYYKVRKHIKYVFLAANSKFKGMSDFKKYEKARKLKNCIGKIREDYYKKLEDKETYNRQLGVATYLIDRLALRVGNEKGEDEADTVGCCTLRVEHIKLDEDYYVNFDFIAKDSMPYHNRVKIEPKVYENLKLFIKAKDKTDNLFDLIDSNKLNDYLKGLMDGLSAKVFRTYNASYVLQQQLDNKTFKIDGNLEEKIDYYNEANKQVAILCNHQKTVPKNYDVRSGEMKENLEENKKYLDDLQEHYKSFSKKSAKKKFKDELEGNVKRIFPNTKEKTDTLIKKIKKKVETMGKKINEREGNKQIALGTSKLNYMDPRITVSWCKKYEVPIEKVFNGSIRSKFPWAMYTEPNYNF